VLPPITAVQCRYIDVVAAFGRHAIVEAVHVKGVDQWARK
jgi:hypothetical protein